MTVDGVDRFGPRVARGIAAAVLVHPVTIAALAGLLLNDLVLKASSPSMATGKVSDVAWLLVLPPVLALGLSPLAGRFGRTRWAAVSVAIPGLVLAVANSSPQGAELVAAAVRWLWPDTGVTVDVTDLLTLPVLWWPWRRLRHTPAATPTPPIGAGAWLLVALAVFGATATSPCETDRPDGINGVISRDRTFWAWEGDTGTLSWFASTDGGRTWTRRSGARPTADRDPTPCGDRRCVEVLPDGSVDVDGEIVWAPSAERQEWVETERLARSSCDGFAAPAPVGPGAAAVGPDGTVVVARGFEGVLVLTSQAGEARPVEVGRHEPLPAENPADATWPRLVTLARQRPGSVSWALLVAIAVMLMMAHIEMDRRAVRDPSRPRGFMHIGVLVAGAITLAVTVGLALGGNPLSATFAVGVGVASPLVVVAVLGGVAGATRRLAPGVVLWGLTAGILTFGVLEVGRSWGVPSRLTGLVALLVTGGVMAATLRSLRAADDPTGPEAEQDG